MSQETSLQRFIDAQATSYPVALSEIQRGRKQSHWMWYIFPQLRGLGVSATAQHYGIQGRSEAQAYAQHPVLGPRLVHISEALLALADNNATRILGSPDDMKLKSSMTLFAALPQAPPVFQQVLDKFYQGKPDEQTLRLLGPSATGQAT
ncbi:DUF1810 domain-containing protein [Hymenobacter sp. B1770]|uniref:DUF1810 domain-containing protein n=1 Tax=Hymenobacter sp. B1770 TaxID=1718788 RepID=UPI003CEF2E9C